MRDRFSHPLTVIGLIVGLLFLAAWELWETSLSNVSLKAEPTSSGRIAAGITVPARTAEKLYTLKGQVVAVTPSSLQIRFTRDGCFDIMKFLITKPLPVKTGDEVRVWYIDKDTGPVADSVIRVGKATDPEG